MPKRQYKILVLLHPEPEGGHSVTVPALPGCHTQGGTIAEALRNAKEAVALCIEAGDVPEESIISVILPVDVT